MFILELQLLLGKSNHSYTTAERESREQIFWGSGSGNIWTGHCTGPYREFNLEERLS